MLPWSFSEEAAAQKYMPQLQHNMWLVAAKDGRAVGHDRRRQMGGDRGTRVDPLYQHLIVTAERKLWRCVENGKPPTLFGVEPPKPRVEAVSIVDMSTSMPGQNSPALLLEHTQHFSNTSAPRQN